MPHTDGYIVRAFGRTVGVTSSSQEALVTLDSYILPFLPRTAADASPDFRLHVEEHSGLFHLSVNGDAVASAANAIDLAPPVIHALDDAVIGWLKDLHAVHAGAVQLNGRVLLLAGGTHAGKSSLVAELLRRGATYFSDEYALVDADGRVHPYARPLLLRNGGAEQSPRLARDFNAPTGTGPAPVGWIFFLQYRQSSSWRVAAIPQSVALLSLLENTPHVLADSPKMVRSFERAVADAACFAGERGDASEAAAHILQLAGA